jgi:XTP/dITP diphosphohydrolase
MRFVLATRNPHKLAEYRAILAPHDVEPMPPGVELPPEGVVSFEANARVKAEGLARALRAQSAPAAHALPGDFAVVIADDSGIEVAALGGAPGVISARYAGREGDDVGNNARLLTELRALPGEHERAARFVCVIAYVAPGVGVDVVRGEWPGVIAPAARGASGFGYDPLFVPTGSARTVAEMSEVDKNAQSHRARAARALLARLTGGPATDSGGAGRP